jgi:hypothetical protein
LGNGVEVGMTEDPLKRALAESRLLPEYELVRRLHTLTPQADNHIAAKVELEARNRRRQFRYYGVVGWIALVASIASLVISASKR